MQPDFTLQEQIRQLLLDRPELRRNLQEMVEWEQAHLTKPGPYALGWLWSHVHTPAAVVNMLVGQGIVDMVSTSRSRTEYQLHSLGDTTKALTLDEHPEAATLNPDDLFDVVVGHQKIKTLLRFSVMADKPVHVLLQGAPGTAKTLMLQDIGRLPSAHFYVGSTTTKAGLVGLLLQERPKYLVIDELDKMAPGDMSPLLNLMENGLVTRLQHGRRDREEMDTRVFAGANDVRRIQQVSPALLSRFAQFDLPPYTASQFVEVARQVLIKREGQGPEMALHIAEEVVHYSTDIRDAVRVARMANREARRVFDVIDCLWPSKRSKR